MQKLTNEQELKVKEITNLFKSKKMNELTEDQKDKLHNIIADTLGCDLKEVIQQDISITNLGADSLDEVEIVMLVEKEFDIEIKHEIAEGIVFVSDYYPVIANLL